MSFTPEQLAQLKELIVQAVKEALGGGNVVAPPPEDKVTLRADGAVQSTKLVNYKQSYAMSADPKRVEFAQYIPEWFFVEEAKTLFKLTPEQELNVHRNTNQARMTGGFLADYLYVGPASVYTKPWFGSPYPESAIPDAASLPGNNGPDVSAVSLKMVPTLFDALYQRYVTTQHVPAWVTYLELVYPK